MFSYVARQPIFDRNLDIYGYELLYRDGPSNAFPNGMTYGITERLFVEQHLTYQGILLDQKLGFVNFDYDDLINELPLEFPNDQYIVEVLETCQPDADLLHALQSLKANDYIVALDDFCFSDKRWSPFIDVADIIKFDIRACPLNQIKHFAIELKQRNKKLLAEKVETYEEYEEAKRLGFDFFQGYFFSKPQLIKHNKLDEVFKANIELLQEISKTEFSVNTIEKIIAKSPSLTIRLFNYVNSQVSIRAEISSINQAVSYLGKERLKRFSSHLILSMCPKNKPNALFLSSLYRAHLLQTLALEFHGGAVAGKAYITGMLSLFDALMDMHMPVILSSLNLDRDITDAILEYKGDLGELLLLVKSLEEGNWSYVDKFQLNHNKISPSMSKRFIDTIAYVNKNMD